MRQRQEAMTPYRIVLITAPTIECAKKLATGLIEEKLAACVNIIPGIHSVYRWQGQVQEDQEAMLICKTGLEQWEPLQQWVKTNHPYELPEIIQIPISQGLESYLRWIGESLEK